MKNYELAKPSRGEHYAYFNANPCKRETGDCVIRAFAVAFDKSWYDIYDALSTMARNMATVPNADDCWKAYIDMQRVEPIQTIFRGKQKWKDGVAFAKAHKEGRYVLRMSNHLSVLVDGCIYDTWDCSDKFVYKAWRVKEA